MKKTTSSMEIGAGSALTALGIAFLLLAANVFFKGNTLLHASYLLLNAFIWAAIGVYILIRHSGEGETIFKD